MSSYRFAASRSLSLAEIDLGFRRYRLQQREAEQSMLRSLQRYSSAAVKRILSVQAEPKTTLETLADQEQKHLRTLLDGSSVPPRSMAEYRTPDPGGALPRQRHAGELRLDVQRRHDRPRVVRRTGHRRVRPPR